MAQQTALSVTATPGKVHTFIAKSASDSHACASIVITKTNTASMGLLATNTATIAMAATNTATISITECG